MENYLLDAVERRRAAASAKAAAAALDDSGDDGEDFTVKGAKLNAAAIVQGWVETDDLAEGETLVDRLYGMLAATVDKDDDGELNEDEALEFQLAVDAAWDYLSANGVSDEDCAAIFDDENNDAAQRARDLLAESLPEGDDATVDAAYAYAESTETVALDGTRQSWAKKHKGRMTIHVKHGKKNVTQHKAKWRRATVAQRAALKKNSRRAHNATARVRFRKSIKVSRRMGGRKVV